VRRWGALLAAAAALALLVAGTVLGQAGQRAAELSPAASAGNTGPRGLAAARVLLVAGGVTVARRGPGDPGLSRAGAVVLAAPAVSLSREDVRALLAAADGGATVLVALGGAGQPALLDELGVSLARAEEPRTAHALAPHPLLGGLSLPARAASLAVLRPGSLSVSGGPGWVSAVSVPAGRGEVLLLSGPEPLENAHLLDGDAVSLITRLGALGPVELDERFLVAPTGEAPPSRRALLLLGAQLLVAGVVYVLARGRRLGAVRPPPAPGAGQTARDYLASLAALYQRTGDEAELAAQTWAAMRRRLERAAGVPALLPDAEAARRLSARTPVAALSLARGSVALAGGGPGLLLRVTRAAADVEAGLGAARPVARPR
jgi:hypothetical protein